MDTTNIVLTLLGLVMYIIILFATYKNGVDDGKMMQQSDDEDKRRLQEAQEAQRAKVKRVVFVVTEEAEPIKHARVECRFYPNEKALSGSPIMWVTVPIMRLLESAGEKWTQPIPSIDAHNIIIDGQKEETK